MRAAFTACSFPHLEHDGQIPDEGTKKKLREFVAGLVS
jgi:hypothetical protein